jgi:hypothetical protein
MAVRRERAGTVFCKKIAEDHSATKGRDNLQAPALWRTLFAHGLRGIQF